MKNPIIQSITNKLKQAIQLDYGNGKDHRVPIVNTNTFNVMFREGVKRNCDKEEFWFSVYAHGLYGRSVQQMRNHFQLGMTYYQEAESLADHYSADYPLSKYYFVGKLPAQAYVEYKNQEFEMAQKTTERMLEIDDELEQDKGIHVLVFHRIQQLHNLARIASRTYNISEWEVINRKLVLFLLNGRNEFKTGNWNFDSMKNASTDLRVLMILQIIREIVSLSFLHEDFAKFVPVLLAEIDQTFDLQVDNCGFEPWLKAKILLQDGSYQEADHLIDIFLEKLPQDTLMQDPIFRKSLQADLKQL